MSFETYAEFDGLGLAALIRAHEITPLEVVDAAIERIERHNPTLNAIVHKAFEEARLTAKAPLSSGPFAGVPMLIKDLGLEVAGWPRTSGSRFTATIVDARDSGLVKRYRSSGAVLIGRSATSEFGILGNTDTAAYGPTRNPWDTDHVVGGSSGGAGAAVAAGLVPIAHGSDGLGSIRIPAACCGLVGLKPTRDRVPDLPDSVDYAIGFVCNHVLTRTVRDCAAMLDATGYPEPASPYATPKGDGHFAEAVLQPPGRLRIRWAAEMPGRAQLDEEVERALGETADTLAYLGHDVTPGTIGVDLRSMTTARMPVSAANFAAVMARTIMEVGRQPLDGELEPLTRMALSLSRQVSGEAALFGMQELRARSRQVLEQFELFDVFLSPVMASPPPPIGWINPITSEPAEIDRLQARLFPFTPIFNYTGQPSISLPLGQSRTGLPIGMMFTARYGDEATLLRLAGQLERAIPWRDKRPEVWN
jgi:amidase